MKVLFLSAGNSIHTVKWVNALAKRGHEVHLVYNRGHEPTNDLIEKSVLQRCLKYSGFAGYYLNAGELSKITKKIKPDVINAHYASGYGTLSRRAKIGPVLLSIWGSDVYDFPYESKWKHRILEKNVRYATMIASTSYCMAEQLKKVVRDATLDITITPFGIDLKLFDKVSEKNKRESNTIVIGNIKALEPIYGLEELCLAIKSLLEELQQKEHWAGKIQVEIYGSGSQKEELEKLIQKLGIEDTIFLRGRIPNVKVPETLRHFDIFCATSRKESFGVAVIEAMSMKVPVVVSDAEGFKEVVKDKETGLIVSLSDMGTIVAALKQLVLDENLRREYGDNGRKRVENLYDWEKNVDIMEALYRKMHMQ